MLRILIREKNGQQRELQVDKEEVVIGRVPSNDLPLPKNNVSKRHAKVVRNNGAWELIDMKSTNGTYVNGERVDDKHVLTPEDQVIIGDFLLQFESVGATPSAPPMPGGAGASAAPGFGPPGGGPSAAPGFGPPGGGPSAAPGFGPPGGGPSGGFSPAPTFSSTPPPPSMAPGGFGGVATKPAPPPGGGGFGLQEMPPPMPGRGPGQPPMAPPPMPPMSPAMSPMSPPPTSPPPMASPMSSPPMPPPPMSPPPMSPPPMSPPPMSPPPMNSTMPPMTPPPAPPMPASPPSFASGPLSAQGPGPRPGSAPGTRPPNPPPIGGTPQRLESRPPLIPPAPPAPPSIAAPEADINIDLEVGELDDLGDLGDLGIDEVDFDEVGEATDLPAPAVHTAPKTIDDMIESNDDVPASPPQDKPAIQEPPLPAALAPPTPPVPTIAPQEAPAPPKMEAMEASAPPTPAPAAPPTPPPSFSPPTPKPKPVALENKEAKETKEPQEPKEQSASKAAPIPVSYRAPVPESTGASTEAAPTLSPDQIAHAQAVGTVVDRLRSRHAAEVRVPSKPDAPSRKELKGLVRDLVKEMRQNSEIERKVSIPDVIEDAIREAVGWGPIEVLLEQPDVTAIVANGSGRIFIEKGGHFTPTETFFSSEAALERAIQRMVLPRGIRIDRSSGTVEARLVDGTWLHAILPPIATQGISLILQPPKHQQRTLDMLVEEGLLSPSMQAFLNTCIKHRRNILLAGDPGSGRTTLLSALAATLPDNERIVSVERVRELDLPQAHWIALETRAPDTQGQGGMSLRALIEHALRIRPQRLLLGDIEGSELHTLMPRMLLGLDGIMMTARATSPEQLLYRLETLMLASPEQPPRHALPHQIGASFDIVIQLNQFGCGTRKVTSICELSCNPDGALFLNEIFAFQKEGNDADGNIIGQFEATGAQPQFYEELARLGIDLDSDIFQV